MNCFDSRPPAGRPCGPFTKTNVPDMFSFRMRRKEHA